MNTHPHTTHNPNTQAPPNCKKEKSLPCKRTQQHTCGLLTCSVDSSIFHWWREDTGHRVGREMSQKQHNSHGKKALVFFSPTDECRCQQSRVVEQNSGIECDGREGVKKKTSWVAYNKLRNHNCNFFFYCLNALPCFWFAYESNKKPPSCSIRRLLFAMMTITLWIRTVNSAQSVKHFLFSYRNWGKAFYSLYFNMYSKCSPCSLCLAKWFLGEVKAHFVPRGSVSAEHEILLPVLLC